MNALWKISKSIEKEKIVSHVLGKTGVDIFYILPGFFSLFCRRHAVLKYSTLVVILSTYFPMGLSLQETVVVTGLAEDPQ
jgi:hypothetical protein